MKDFVLIGFVYKVSDGCEQMRNTQYKCHFYPGGSMGGLGGMCALKFFYVILELDL